MSSLKIDPSTITRSKVKSSNINSIGYYEPEKILTIEFSSHAVYAYWPVLPKEHRRLVDAASIGGYFFKEIKGNPKINFKKV